MLWSILICSIYIVLISKISILWNRVDRYKGYPKLNYTFPRGLQQKQKVMKFGELYKVMLGLRGKKGLVLKATYRTAYNKQNILHKIQNISV